MKQDSHINSPQYWDQRFQHDWAKNGGEAYTRSYAELLVEYLPDWLVMEARRTRMSLCDWGCAEGEAVAYLSQLFPEQRLAGVDVAETAVANARAKYPDLEFSAADWLAPDAERPTFDIVLTSHVLEHFATPVDIVRNILAEVADKMIIMLVPYAEDPDHKDPEHFFRFLDLNLPLHWPGWSCLFFRVLDTRLRKGVCWRGQQCLVVYAKNEWIQRENIQCFLNSMRGETEVLQQKLAHSRDHTKQLEVAKALSDKKLEIQFLHDQNFVRTNEILRTEIKTLKTENHTLKSEQGALKPERDALKIERDALKSEKDALKTEKEGQDAQIAQLTRRNEQLRADLERAERAHAKKHALLTSPPALMRYYAAALLRRLKRLITKNGDNVPTAARAPNSDDSAPEKTPPAPADTPATSPPPVIPKTPPPPSLIPRASRTRRKEAPLKSIRMGAILDEFTHACLAPECTLVDLSPTQWQTTLNAGNIDLLFVESAWHGNQDAWQYRIASYPNPAGAELDDVLRWCQKQNIPTVFWNKEDPPNYDRFISAAKKFDYVFTTDANCIEDYRKACGHDRIAPLPFAAQPAIHNPLLTTPRENKVCFAGTYYADCFPRRRRHMESMLRGSVIYGLDIYDRMSGHEGDDKERFLFPEQFRPYIRGKLNYHEMLAAYRRYKAFLNVNSVDDSPTMFARRVFELMACGTPVISTPSLGMEQMFGALTPQVQTDGETRKALKPFMEDELFWMRQSALGIRRIMSEHTYAHRLQDVCAALGLRAHSDMAPPCVVALIPGAAAERCVDMLLAQVLKPARVYVLDMAASAQALAEQLRAQGIETDCIAPEQATAHIQDTCLDACVAVMHGEHGYGPHYLHDACQALSYSGCAMTGLDGCFHPESDTSVVLNSGESAPGFVHENCLAATVVCRAEALTEAMLVRPDAPDGRTACAQPCYLRMPFEFIYNPPEPLPDEIRVVAYL